MLTRPKSLRKHHYVVIAAVAVAAIGALLFFCRGKNSDTPLTVPQLYQKELANLSADLSQLSAYLDEKREISEDLNQYTAGLTNLKNPCRQMNIYHDRYKNDGLSDRIKDTMSNSQQLCGDFLDLLDYSQAVYMALEPYMTISTKQWPYANSQDFDGHMVRIGNTLDTSLQSLKAVRNTVQDPGAGELIAQVELAKTKLTQIKVAKEKNDLSAADKLTDELIALLEQDKIDFMNARTYFWRNTVQLEALQKAVGSLSAKFDG